MAIWGKIIEFIFSSALFINALLFIPQCIKIIKDKEAKDISLITFIGFLLIQFAIVLHGIIKQDYILVSGYLLSMLTCGSVVVLIFLYRRRKNILHKDYLSHEEVMAQLPGHVYWKDKNGLFLGCNTNNWRDFGLKSYEDFLGKNDYDLFSKQEADLVTMNDKEVMRCDTAVTFEELFTVSPNRKILYLSYKMPLKNKNNEIIGILGLSVDITKAKQEIQNQLDILENIIAVMPGHIYWINKEGFYLGCNDIQAKAIGLSSRKDIVGKRNIDLPGFSIPEVLDVSNKEVLEKGQTITIEEPAILQDGTHATFLSNKVPLRNSSNEVVGMVGISIDITEMKRKENETKAAKEIAEKILEEKKQILRNMEHDIRTPFSGIYSVAGFLEDLETDPQKLEFIKIIKSSSHELLEYCNKFIEFARIEDGLTSIQHKVFDLKKVAEKVIVMISSEAKNKNLALALAYAENAPKYLVSDPFRIQKLLMNLVGNSVKFTETGFVKLTIKYLKNDKTDKKAIMQFIIEDTGIGIPAEHQNFVYEKMAKVTPSNHNKYRGSTGLGLSMVKIIIEELEGQIELKSELGKGTTFICTLPLELSLSDEEPVDDKPVTDVPL